MENILNGFIEAIRLIFTFNTDLYEIIFLSIKVSIIATIISSLISMPIGITLGLYKYRYKNIVGRILYSFMSVPSVLVGLLVSIFISRKGPLGSLELMYTETAMVIAQTILLMPLLIGLYFNMAKNNGKEILKFSKTMGCNFRETIFLVIYELRYMTIIASVTAFSRAISEVGAVSIVGGNIEHHTRVMTTSIIMYQSMGEYEMAIALGVVLLMVSLIINSLLYTYEEE